MRPSSDPRAVALAFITIVCGACDAIEITLQLRAGINSDDLRVDTSTIETVRIILADEEGTQNDVTLPIDRSGQQPLPDIEVERSRPFSVDVWGCEVVDRCDEGDVAFRGCQLVDLSKQAYGSSHPIPVDIIEADDVKVRGCPPKTQFD